MSIKSTGTVKEILGTCHSLGLTVNGRTPLRYQRWIDEGRVEVPDEDVVTPFLNEKGYPNTPRKPKPEETCEKGEE